MNIDIILPDITSTLQITGCHFGVRPANWYYPKHHHHLYELLYCQSGEAEQIINGAHVKMKAGDWLFIKAGVRHQTDNRTDGHFSFFNTHFDIDNAEIRKRLSTIEFALYPKEVTDKTQLPLYLREVEKIMHSGIMDEFPIAGSRTGHLALSYENKIAQQSFILLIIREILLIQKPTGEDTVAYNQGTTMYKTDIAHAIEERLQRLVMSDGSISEIARDLNLSQSQCTKIFTKIYGIPPRQYVIQLKLNKAKHLLVTTNRTIEEIAAELGFHSASHFSRQFRQGIGIPPNQFRPKHMIGKAEQ